MRRIASIAALALLAACQPEAAAPAAETPFTVPAPKTLPNGATLTYLRSNQDGTLPENIFVHVVSPTEVHVAKMVERCTDAAYVTAVFDPASREATTLVGGRLQKDGTQLPQAWLTLDPATRKLDIRVGDPASAPIESHPAPTAPWRMYDFDFAEFALFGPREPKDFTFGLALAWPDTAPPLVQVLGDVKAEHVMSPLKVINGKGRVFHVFRLSGPALPDGGDLSIDAATGHVGFAKIQRPNHSGYSNFQLELKEEALDNGETVWRDALVAHWKDC